MQTRGLHPLQVDMQKELTTGISVYVFKNECKHLVLHEKTPSYLGLRTQMQIISGAQENVGRGCSGLLVGITCSIHLGLGEFDERRQV